MTIKDSVILVTGGASGLGLEITSQLVKQGARTIVFDINNEALSMLPSDVDRYCVDVTSCKEVQDSILAVMDRYGKIDGLINNAGSIYSEPLINIMNLNEMKHSYEQFTKQIEINLHSVFIMTSSVVEQMVLKRTKGTIVNISSISSVGNAGQTAYSAAKAGVIAMTKTWAKELGAFGIRSVAISPGFMDTGSTESALNPSIINHIVSNTPLKRLGEASCVAQSVLHALENDFINGTVIEVDGGLTI